MAGAAWIAEAPRLSRCLKGAGMDGRVSGASAKRVSERFNRERNQEKAIASLIGLCKGLIADQRLNERELLFFDSWLRNQKSLVDDPDVVDLIDLITEIVADGEVELDEIDELKSLLGSVVRNREHAGTVEAEINELLSIIRGIRADGRLNDSELLYLRAWIDRCTVGDEYPANVIADRIAAVLADGIIEPSELEDLADTLGAIVGDQFEQTGMADGASTSFCTADVDELDHAGRVFCFTGKFISGSRSAIERRAQGLGAETVKNVSSRLHYLVIGSIASGDWRFSSHGRKIEAALKLQREGHPVAIVSEQTWQRFAEI